MTPRERVLAALGGQPVDRVPISFWGHNYLAENSADGLARETLRQARRFNWDYLKPQSRAQAFAEMWGLRYAPSGAADRKYTVTHFPVRSAGELARLRPADPNTGALGEQIDALRQIREGVGPDVPIIWTVFSPLMIARFLLAGDAAELLEIARSEPDALSKALAAVAETVDGYVRLCLANGADGIFYATNLATRDHLTPDECQRFQRTHDLDVLASAGDAPFNVMHICGQDARLEAFVDYPVAAFSFALGPGNWTLSEAHRRTGKASMGGLPNHFAGVSASDLTSRARAAIDEMGGRWLLLAPECSIEPGTPEELLLAAGASPRSPESDVRGGGGPL